MPIGSYGLDSVTQAAESAGIKAESAGSCFFIEKYAVWCYTATGKRRLLFCFAKRF